LALKEMSVKIPQGGFSAEFWHMFGNLLVAKEKGSRIKASPVLDNAPPVSFLVIGLVHSL
jgi:hypothetical protein